MSKWLQKAKDWARTVKRDAHALYLASRDPRVPWYAKVLALAVAGYALSPIDLIPDFIPVFGYLDDVIIVPLGILLVIRLIRPISWPNIASWRQRRKIGPSAAPRPSLLSSSGSRQWHWSVGSPIDIS